MLQGPLGAIGDIILQPGKHDDSRVELNKVGQVVRSHLGAAGDCAIASITGRKFSSNVLGLGVAVSAIGDPEIGDKAIKSGRTTGITRGIVVRIEVNAKLQYGGGVSAIIGGFENRP